MTIDMDALLKDFRPVTLKTFEAALDRQMENH